PVANAQQPTAQATTAPPTNAPAYAQLSSQRSPEVAQQIANDLSARYAPLLNGVKLEVTRADLGARGIYYRVRVPAASQAGAAQFCASVRANGGDCVAM
ncbi:MAG TPA: SPOR domain-containing protein, partial [Devosia sp.]|nr:SPOR domain-containing protein [Devosia sp.]